ncbi:hypothetical protein ARMGADRAFT_1063938 [Armillaria gallica]|uniref:Uncharacterized protein n=1 Tax=Armillaria gallica TaxID=47427 RepID=A0A2H3DMF7_ARMGA|nr:hypothetical protein ARMGADRAFT_1063938 [Armillaria gallica]
MFAKLAIPLITTLGIRYMMVSSLEGRSTVDSTNKRHAARRRVIIKQQNGDFLGRSRPSHHPAHWYVPFSLFKNQATALSASIQTYLNQKQRTPTLDIGEVFGFTRHITGFKSVSGVTAYPHFGGKNLSNASALILSPATIQGYSWLLVGF